MMDTPLVQIQSPYDLPKLVGSFASALLPLRDQPAYRVDQNADACNLAELLAAIVGGQNQCDLGANEFALRSARSKALVRKLLHA